MKTFAIVFCFLAIAAGPALAQYQDITEGFPQDPTYPILPIREDVCQYGFQDDGIGFTPPMLADHPAAASKLGLMGMHERARLLSGSLLLDSAPGQGTRVIVNVPA